VCGLAALENHQVVIDADTRLVVAVGRPLPGNRNDCKAWELSGAKAAAGKAVVIADGGYRGTGLVIPHRRERGQDELPSRKEEHNASHRKARARVEHVFARMKTWKTLCDCRLKGDGAYHAMLGIAPLHNVVLTGEDQAGRAWSAGLCHPAQGGAARRELAMADPPAVSGSHDGVVVGDGTAGAVRLDAQPLGTDLHPVLRPSGDDDIGDMVRDRVGRSQRPCRFSDGCHPGQRLLAEVGEVVDRIGGEQLLQPVKASVVNKMTMQRDQFGDGQAIFKGERHTRPLWPGVEAPGRALIRRQHGIAPLHAFGRIRQEHGRARRDRPLPAVSLPPTCLPAPSAEARLTGQRFWPRLHTLWPARRCCGCSRATA